MGSNLTDLTEAECWKNLETKALARIAWSSGGGPQILPVNYVAHDGALWLRTTPHSSMAEQVDESPVALEVDDIDTDTHVGWSVVVRGRAEAIYRSEDVPSEVTALRAWASGARAVWLRVSADQVTGKLLTDD
jgi:nitroimidazol reductase NimA-like FMN-containing flavoprotein (pyridoxamine 5'-phosphate oxidase superfamily)